MTAPLMSDLTAPALAFAGVTRSFRGHAALDDVTFQVPQGAFTVLLGPAGAGKTTTLRIAAGLDGPDTGMVAIGGRDAGGLEPRDRDLAMIFDNLALYPNKTGFRNIASPLEIRRVSPAEIEARVTAIAATLRISHVLQRLPRTMSGGERQRVALGRALIRAPKLFLLDEPLSSLDAMLRIELRAELKRLQRELGHAFLLATPDFAEALAIADTVVLIRAGRVVLIADPQTLYDLPADREAARFVGAPEINLVPVALQGGDRLNLAGGLLAAPAPLAACLARAGGAAEAGIRPEHLTLVDPAAADLRATLSDVEPLGLKAALTVTTPDGTALRLVVEAASVRGVAIGAPVGLAVDCAPMVLFDRASGKRLT